VTRFVINSSQYISRNMQKSSALGRDSETKVVHRALISDEKSARSYPLVDGSCTRIWIFWEGHRCRKSVDIFCVAV
jgi:hypothetical protein